MESKNVIDFFKYWKTEAVKAYLDERRHNFSVLCSNHYRDINLSGIVRCCNAFLAKDIFIYGFRKFDRRGTVGTHVYENIKFVQDLNQLDEGPIIVVDNIPEAKDINTFKWPKEHFYMAFGEETAGTPKNILDRASDVVYIPMYGSVRSLNTSVAAGIAMSFYCRGLYS